MRIILFANGGPAPPPLPRRPRFVFQAIKTWHRRVYSFCLQMRRAPPDPPTISKANAKNVISMFAVGPCRGREHPHSSTLATFFLRGTPSIFFSNSSSCVEHPHTLSQNRALAWKVRTFVLKIELWRARYQSKSGPGEERAHICTELWRGDAFKLGWSSGMERPHVF